MRAEAVSWDDWSVSNPPTIVDDEKWHVQFAPDEVKVVSLEQMDDLFRLSIIDSETQVWQPGMREWQPLRVIAGLEEEPTPQPQRSYPKPPAPNRAASPSVRPAPPPPRPVASVRPPAPERRPSMAPAPERRPAMPPARPAYVEPASFYPEPVHAAPAPYASAATYAAPIAFAAPVNAMNSVRPLVVSHVPPPARSGGGGFGRLLVGVSLIAGLTVTAYRNDLVREGAHAAHQDALYARLENALGGPAFGTVRALEQSAAAQPLLDAPASDVTSVRNALASPSLEAPSTAAPTTATGATPVVSLESLAQEKKGQSAASVAGTQSASDPTQVAPANARATASVAQPKQAATPAPAKSQSARAVAIAKAPMEKPAPHKPASEMNERERLNAAIGQSMQSAAPKAKGGKAKPKGNEYDPLNPSL